MTVQEFSNTFDTLLSSYTLNSSFGETSSPQEVVLDEYEKSCFLTLAQEEIVLSYYNGKNTYAESFEKTEEIRRYLSDLVSTVELSPIAITDEIVVNEHSQIFTLPNNLWFITYEIAKLPSSSDACTSEREIQVVPVTQDDLYRTLENPFKGIGYRRALRLDIADNKVELISKYTIDKYLIRYIRKINPIILLNLSEGLSINGETSAATCELHESLHRPIIDLAVRLALQSKGIKIQ